MLWAGNVTQMRTRGMLAGYCRKARMKQILLRPRRGRWIVLKWAL
jgi:hypothetical protein